MTRTLQLFAYLHPNGSFSRDSQSGVLNLSRFGLPGLWAFITSRPELGSGRGLNQSCSSPWELSNGVSHFTCTHRDQVDSRLLVVGSQIVNLTPGPSFDHNLCYRCPNGSCEAILDIYTSRPFQRYKKRLNARCFDPWNHALSFRESRRTPKSHFRECEWRPHNSLKVGLQQGESEASPNFDINVFTKTLILEIKHKFFLFLSTTYNIFYIESLKDSTRSNEHELTQGHSLSFINFYLHFLIWLNTCHFFSLSCLQLFFANILKFSQIQL
jgi:hypothetical protein